jgi:uncharacterized damage-inducible protein DinB
MSTQAQLQEFDHEMAATRKILERIPDEKLTWRPHEKSRTIAQLADHIANLAGFPVQVVEQEGVDLPAPGSVPAKPLPASRQELLSKFDANAAASRAALTKLKPESVATPWTLSRAGKTIVALPRGAMLRMMALSHVIHHRAQLGVYLRLNNVAVPAVYGPSADEANA